MNILCFLVDFPYLRLLIMPFLSRVGFLLLFLFWIYFGKVNYFSSMRMELREYVYL